MEILILRKIQNKEYTIGDAYVNGVFFSNSLENTQYLISIGVYGVILNKSPKFGRVLPRLVDVPEREGILIHRGNTAEDFTGCIGLGNNNAEGRIDNTTDHEEKIIKVIRAAIDRDEAVSITVANSNLL